MLSSIPAITQYTRAVDSTKPSESMDLGNPFLVEHYRERQGKQKQQTRVFLQVLQVREYSMIPST